MWLFTEMGFYSAVVGKDNPDQIVVRARDRDDLVRLLDAFWVGETPEILDEGGDYPHRIVMDRDTWSEIVYESAQGIDYRNFKDRVHDVSGPGRAHTYLKVWSALLELEKERCFECGARLTPNEYTLCDDCVQAVVRAHGLAQAKLRHPQTTKNKAKGKKKQGKLKLA